MSRDRPLPPLAPASDAGATPAAPQISLATLLAETTAVQGVGTMAILTIPALAPAVAASLDVPASHAGYQIGLVYLSGMAISLFSGRIVAAAGPCRTGQMAMLLSAAGCMIASVPVLPAIVLGSVFLGFSYGLINPAASALLVRHSPPAQRNLIFSVKQSGVPLGGIAAGLVGPRLALTFGWTAALWTVAALAVAIAAISQIGRQALDDERSTAAPGAPISPKAFQVMGESATLRWLALSSLCFSAVQLCFITFLVTLLVEELGFDLVSAGVLLAIIQAVGAAARIGFGVLADRLRNGPTVLMGLAIVSAVSSTWAAVLPPHGPSALAIVPFLLLGASAVGWNGVFLSEVARSSPPGSVGATTGAAMFFTFFGVVVGPPIFASLHHALGSYLRGYLFLAAVSFAGAVMLTAARSLAKSGRPPVSSRTDPTRSMRR